LKKQWLHFLFYACRSLNIFLTLTSVLSLDREGSRT
jgi:hypothetical protein